MKSLILAVIVVSGLAAACSPSNLATSPSASTPGQPTLHVVAPGDTYESVAARYRLEVPALLSANGLTTTAPLNPGQPLVIPAAAPAAAPASAPSTVEAPTEGAGGAAETAPPPAPFSKEWWDIQIQRGRTFIEDIRARKGGIFFLGGAALLGGFLALQVVIWLVRELILTFLPLVRKLAAVGHDLWLNVWYAAWWVGLAFWVPANAAWRVLRPFVEPRARALGRFALERGTTWSRRGARWAQGGCPGSRRTLKK